MASGDGSPETETVRGTVKHVDDGTGFISREQTGSTSIGGAGTDKYILFDTDDLEVSQLNEGAEVEAEVVDKAGGPEAVKIEVISAGDFESSQSTQSNKTDRNSPTQSNEDATHQNTSSGVGGQTPPAGRQDREQKEGGPFEGWLSAEGDYLLITIQGCEHISKEIATFDAPELTKTKYLDGLLIAAKFENVSDHHLQFTIEYSIQVLDEENIGYRPAPKELPGQTSHTKEDKLPNPWKTSMFDVPPDTAHKVIMYFEGFDNPAGKLVFDQAALNMVDTGMSMGWNIPDTRERILVEFDMDREDCPTLPDELQRAFDL